MFIRTTIGVGFALVVLGCGSTHHAQQRGAIAVDGLDLERYSDAARTCVIAPPYLGRNRAGAPLDLHPVMRASGNGKMLMFDFFADPADAPGVTVVIDVESSRCKSVVVD